MSTIRPEITGRAIRDNLEPLAVSPRRACQLLDVGNTRLYQLISDGELDTYLDGRSRKITVASIHRRIARLLATAGATAADTEAALPRRGRGRPRKRAPEATA
jgi:excisionase family DNA binding protein